MSFAAGALVRARGRDWVVLPESQGDLLILRPLGAGEEETAGVYLPLEPVEPASFPPPDPARAGDFRSGRLLRDAVRLGFRSSAGPFRCFGSLALDPRPYQLVPLLMALRMDPVRLLIADDVGVGKTIEACLIASELLARGEATRLAVLCPPQLAEQWVSELDSKFGISAEAVLPGTAARLERDCRVGQSLFDLHPFVVVSTDFVKSDRRREEFLRSCPELVIVDEAHTCAAPAEGSRTRHQRHRLVQSLAADPRRHLVLVTATPHSGNEEAFRSLLGLLRPEFAELPADLGSARREQERKRLAACFVQRRRSDIARFLHSETPFPERDEREVSYRLTGGYRALFEAALAYARESVVDQTGGQVRQRVRWWSALALLRSIGSSPAAAAATLRARAAGLEAETEDEVDALGRLITLEALDDDLPAENDTPPGVLEIDGASAHLPGAAHLPGPPPATGGGWPELGAAPAADRLLELALQADALHGEQDAKLAGALELVAGMLKKGRRPIVFCRFIPTAEYVAQALSARLGAQVVVRAVTGLLPPEERESAVAELAEAERRVLVCTDCLSEGVNLQRWFDAVLHYDLSWNPTRHEQREGRVDRYGQPAETVSVVTYYGADNQIDGVVLDVLLRKHRAIRNALGVAVPVPARSEQVLDAIFHGLLLRGHAGANHAQLTLDLDSVLTEADVGGMHRSWDEAREREAQTRSRFAQEGIQPDDVARELREAQEAAGSNEDACRFVREALQDAGATVKWENGRLDADLFEAQPGAQDAMQEQKLAARFSLPVQPGEIYLHRAHPRVRELAQWVLDSALDPESQPIASRCGVVRTRAVQRRTTLLLLRRRYDIVEQRRGAERVLLAEDTGIQAYRGPAEAPEWVSREEAEALLAAEPAANVHPEQARTMLSAAIEALPLLAAALEDEAKAEAGRLLDAHLRVRSAAADAAARIQVLPHLPPDVLGVYVLLPVA